MTCRVLEDLYDQHIKHMDSLCSIYNDALGRNGKPKDRRLAAELYRQTEDWSCTDNQRSLNGELEQLLLGMDRAVEDDNSDFFDRLGQQFLVTLRQHAPDQNNGGDDDSETGEGGNDSIHQDCGDDDNESEVAGSDSFHQEPQTPRQPIDCIVKIANVTMKAW